MNPVLYENFVKIDEQAKREFFETEICDDLCRMDWQRLIHGFQFDQQLFFHNHIGAIANLESEAFIVERHRQLQLMFNTTQSKLMAQAGFIGAFQQPRPKFTVNCKGRVHHHRGKTFNIFRNMNPLPAWDF